MPQPNTSNMPNPQGSATLCDDGDFNANVKTDDWLVRHVADTYGFHLVSDTAYPTTVRGSCIDLVFADRKDLIAPVLREPLTVHFTDHKAIVLVCNKASV